MLRLGEFVGPLVLVLWIFCFIDALLSRDEDVRNLPKVAWVLLVLFFPVLGSVAWLVAGRPQAARPRAGERAVPTYPEYDRPGRMAASSGETDEEFLRRCRERAEAQRRAHRARRRAEQGEQDGDAATPGG